jgi:hypothetical protein
MPLTGTKSPFSSLTIRGALVLLIPIILKLLGVDLGADAAGLISNIADTGIQFVGLVMVVYGRFRATQKVSLDASP